MKSFFENKGPFDLDFLISKTNFVEKKKYRNLKLSNISTIKEAVNNEITFFENIKYIKLLNTSKASCVLIKKNHLSFLTNNNIQPIISKYPLLDFILIAKTFYPEANYDDNNIKIGKKFNDFLKKNIIIDERVEIGKNVQFGSNTTIKKNVKIGDNVIIGSNCVISNSIIGDNVIINDGSIIGKIGFGFKLINNQMMFIPHIGCVKLNNNVYIGSNCTIDRGSFSDTIIGSGTMLDNQVHVAHNCKIGENCFIAGQVGIAGSTIIGDNCMIGGQAGVSGHLKIGKNVYIGGGSGVLNNVNDNSKIMGYPASNMRNFLNKQKNKTND